MKDFNDIVLFGKKTFADLLKEIYNNSVSKSKSIKELLGDLPPVVDIATATTIGPLIAGLIKEDVKNDENLIKLAGVVSRLINAKEGEDGDSISEEEKRQLLKQANELVNDIKNG